MFDEIEFDAAASGDHRTAAEQMIGLAATGTQTEEFPRSEAYLRAGEQWLLADDPAAAAQGFRQALADGGPAFVDPRVPLARALFLMDKAAEAEALIRQIELEKPEDPRICDLVAELLVERSDLRGALRWATTGVGLCLGRLGAGWDLTSRPSPPGCGPVLRERGSDRAAAAAQPALPRSGLTSACPRTTTTGCWTSSRPGRPPRPGTAEPGARPARPTPGPGPPRPGRRRRSRRTAAPGPAGRRSRTGSAGAAAGRRRSGRTRSAPATPAPPG